MTTFILQLILLYLAMYGISNIIIESTLFEKPRMWAIRNKRWLLYIPNLIFCYMCLSFWLGVISTILLFSPTAIVFALPVATHIFLDGCIASAVVWLLRSFETYLTK